MFHIFQSVLKPLGVKLEKTLFENPSLFANRQNRRNFLFFVFFVTKHGKTCFQRKWLLPEVKNLAKDLGFYCLESNTKFRNDQMKISSQFSQSIHKLNVNNFRRKKHQKVFHIFFVFCFSSQYFLFDKIGYKKRIFKLIMENLIISSKRLQVYYWFIYTSNRRG